MKLEELFEQLKIFYRESPSAEVLIQTSDCANYLATEIKSEGAFIIIASNDPDEFSIPDSDYSYEEA